MTTAVRPAFLVALAVAALLLAATSVVALGDQLASPGPASLEQPR